MGANNNVSSKFHLVISWKPRSMIIESLHCIAQNHILSAVLISHVLLQRQPQSSFSCSILLIRRNIIFIIIRQRSPKLGFIWEEQTLLILMLHTSIYLLVSTRLLLQCFSKLSSDFYFLPLTFLQQISNCSLD